MRVELLDDIAEAASPEVKASDDLAGQVAAPEGTDTKTLRDTWRKAWGRGAPKGARKRFLILGISWKWQTERFGGFDRELARRLSALETCGPIGGADPVSGTCEVKLVARPAAGTRLVRDWLGERNEVHMLESGYFWRGRTYGSLSGVATAFTGVNRNGPKFFGLRDGRR